MPDTQAQSAAAQAAGQRKLALFETVFEEIPGVIVLKDANGDFLLCNHALARLYNATPEAMVGKHDGDFGVPKALAEGFRANLLNIMARGETEVVFEDSRNAVTGEIRHFKSIKRPFKDADDKPAVWQRLRQLLSSGDEFYRSEHRMLRKDGAVIWVLDRGRVAERNAQGEVVRVVGAYVDISERKCHEVALQQALAQANTSPRVG